MHRAAKETKSVVMFCLLFLLFAARGNVIEREDGIEMECESMAIDKIDKKQLGQYFTPRDMAEFMLDLSHTSNDAKVLEPSSGEGVFLDLLFERGYSNVVAYEIDPLLADGRDCVKCESFVSAELSSDFDLVIGNPPYIRWKNLPEQFKDELSHNALWNKHFNALCDYAYIFMLKGVETLKDGGELIFICPEYWMNTTHAESLRKYLLENGYFSDFYIFNEAPIFKGATVSSVVFRFVKSKLRNKPKMRVAKFTQKMRITPDVFDKLRKWEAIPNVEYLEIPQFEVGDRWVFAPSNEVDKLKCLMESCCMAGKDGMKYDDGHSEMITIGDVCDIGNGMVSGLDKAFQLPDDISLTDREQHDSIMVYKAKDLTPYFALHSTRYIYVPENVTDNEEFEKFYPHFHSHLKPFAEQLKDRYQYNRQTPYWQWSFKRNERLFSRNEQRIFVPCKERISAKSYVRFALAEAGYYPTQDVTALFKKPDTKESIEYILAYLNHPLIFKWIKHFGVAKGNIVEFSEKPLASIPFRRINWENDAERKIHDDISADVKSLLESHNMKLTETINTKIEELLK